MKSRILTAVMCLLVGICLIRVFSGYAANGSQQEKATPVDNGVLTAREREHSKLYKAYGAGRKLSDLASTEEGDVEIRISNPLSGGLPDSPTMMASQFLKHDACRAEAIVIGTVTEKSSQITEDGEFIFTDYELIVDDVVKQNDSAAIRIGGEVTVSRPGGTILLRGKRIRAMDSLFQPLRPGGRYVIFLMSIPTTGSYREIETGGSIRLDGNKATKGLDGSLHGLEIKSDTISFISEVRVTAAACDPRGAK